MRDRAPPPLAAATGPLQLADTMPPTERTGGDEPRERDEGRGELFRELERRALENLPEHEDEGPDLLGSLSPGGAGEEAPGDLTLGGYLERHGRVPAFEGNDGQPYTVDVEVEPSDRGGHAAFLVFVRWAATGAGIMDHTESDDVATGATEAEARAAALELSLYEVKAELDRAIERRRQALEE